MSLPASAVPRSKELWLPLPLVLVWVWSSQVWVSFISPLQTTFHRIHLTLPYLHIHMNAGSSVGTGTVNIGLSLTGMTKEVFKPEDTGHLVVYGLEAYAWKVSCDCNVVIHSSVHEGKPPESRRHKLPVVGLQHGPAVPKKSSSYPRLVLSG